MFLKFTLSWICRSAGLEKSVFGKFCEGQNHDISHGKHCQSPLRYLLDTVQLRFARLFPIDGPMASYSIIEYGPLP